MFESTRERWPESFFVHPKDGTPAFDSEPNLVAVHHLIEDSCRPSGEWTQDDEWTHLAIWAFHQALWALAEKATTAKSVSRDDVTFDMFDHFLRSNLSHECWDKERQEYEASPLRIH